jgi:hypothetical protein
MVTFVLARARQATAQVAQRVLRLVDQFHDVFHETPNVYHDL